MAHPIGAQLRQIRESQGISLESISQKTHISLEYLRAIESGDEETLPSKVHLRGFLRLYANELGVQLDNNLKVRDDISREIGHESLLPDSLNDNHEVEEKKPEENQKEENNQEPDSDQKIETDKEIKVKSTKKAVQELDSKPQSDQVSFPSSVIHPQDTIEASSAKRTSTEVFTAIGRTIKQRRELLSLSIKNIHDNIHIPEQHLTSIEAGQFDQLPSPVQAKGMLMNYSDYLNLDTDSLLLEFTDGLQFQRIEKQAQLPKRGKPSAKELSPSALRLKNFFSLDLLVITVLFIVFAVFVIWGVNRILTNNTPATSDSDIPGVSDILLATDTQTPFLTAEANITEIDQEQEQEPPADEEVILFTPLVRTEPINIIMVPRQRLWVQVTVDDQVVFQGRLIPGNAYDFSGQDQVDILIGNAGALQILFNDQDIGSVGLPGQVVNLIFTDTGLVLPPPTPTPTITETPQDTPTPTASPTPTENNE